MPAPRALPGQKIAARFETQKFILETFEVQSVSPRPPDGRAGLKRLFGFIRRGKLAPLFSCGEAPEDGRMRASKREKAWTDFEQWCRDRRLRSLPAHPWTLAAYARWCETRHRYPAIVERIQSIARIHLLACAASPDRHPMVMRTLRSLELRNRTRAGRAALFPVDEVAPATHEEPAPIGPAPSGPAQGPMRGRRRKTALRTAPRLVSRRPRRG